MFALCLLIFLLFGSLSAQSTLDQLFSTCSQNYQVDPYALQQVRTNPSYTPTDRNLMCLVLCVGQSTNVLSSNGYINGGGAALQSAYFDINRVQQALSSCSQLYGNADSCQTGYLQWQCLVQLAGNSNVYGTAYNTYGSFPGSYLTGYPYYTAGVQYPGNTGSVQYPANTGSVQYPTNTGTVQYPVNGQYPSSNAVIFPGNYLGR